MIAASVKPCIVIGLDTPFKHAPLPGAFDLYFTFLVILPDAGAISTSAEFLFLTKFYMYFKTLDCGHTLIHVPHHPGASNEYALCFEQKIKKKKNNG